MLKDLIAAGFGLAEDYNCAEKIFHGANQAYDLQIDKKYAHLLASYGGGMAIEHLCGAVASSVAILGYLFIKDHAHESEYIKELTTEFTQRYEKEMGSILCKPLKEAYRTEEKLCLDVILKAAQILDDMVKREEKNITKPYKFQD
jgi:C_GCAxxG_C_C family probable redox protein